MNIIILNTNSFGGNYEYSRCLARAYSESLQVKSCRVLIPENAPEEQNEVYKKVLISDVPVFTNVFLKKAYFVYRSFINPIRTFLFLKKQPPSVVLFNDYEQISAWFWVPLFRLLKPRHTFVVILHDPDRDAYFSVKALSVSTMKAVMSVMDMALYHEILPVRTYYTKNIPFVNVPHGIYAYSQTDPELKAMLARQKDKGTLMGMIGNIRDEKNYRMVIECLNQLPDVTLVIAGSPANSNAPVQEYKELIRSLGLQDRVCWIEKRLSDNEMQSVIEACDLILLYYKKTFASQSGILNRIAPYKKKLIVSDAPSALQQTVRDFSLGDIVSLDPESFIAAVKKNMREETPLYRNAGWDQYLEKASWKNHVELVLGQISKRMPDK